MNPSNKMQLLAHRWELSNQITLKNKVDYKHRSQDFGAGGRGFESHHPPIKMKTKSF